MAKKKVVLLNGCFDPLHWGHLQHIKAAREFGDEIVVSVTADKQVRQEKGSGRPTQPAARRVEMLQAVRFVDWTVIVESPVQAVLAVKPDVFVKGRDYIGRISAELEKACKELGVRIEFTRTEMLSATAIGNELRRRE